MLQKVKENKLLQDKQNSFIAQNENTVHLRSKSDELRIKDNNNNSDLEIEEIETSMTYFCTPSIRATATSTQPRFSISNIFSDSALDDSSATSTGNVTKTTLKDTEGTKSITSLPAAPATAGACAQTCVLPSPASDSRRGRKRKSGSVVPIDIPRTKKTGNYGRISDISEEQAGCQVSGKALLKPSSLDNSVLSLNKEECSHLDNPASLYTKENNEHLKGRVNRFRVFYNSNFAQGPHSTASTNMPDNVLNSLLLESSASGNRDGVEKYPEVYLTPTENRLNEMSFTNVEELINHDANGSSLSNNIHAEKCDQEKYINRMCVPQSRIIAGARRISEPGSRDTGNCNKFVPQECSVAYAAENNIENAGNLKGRRIINDVGQSTSKEMAEVDTAISTANSDECLVVDVCTSCEFDSSVVIQDNHLHATVEADIHCVQTDNVLDNLKEKEDVVTVKIQERKSQNQDALFPAKDISEEGIDVHSCQAEIPGSSAAYSDKPSIGTFAVKSTSDSEDDDVLSIYASSWTGIDSDAEGEKDNLEYQKLIDPNEITRDLGQEQTYSGKSGKVCLDQYTTKHAKENTLDFCNDNETVCKISGDAHCTQDLSINNGTATSEISCRRNTLILGSNQSCTRNASSGLYQDKEPDKLDQISTLNLNQSLLESEEHVNVRELLHVTRESGQENRSCENGDKSIPVQYSNMTAETRAEHTESNIILTLKTNLGESLSTVDNLHIPHNSRHTMSQEKNIVTKEDNHRANIYGYLPSSPDLMTKQTDNVNVNSGLYPREGRPTGDHNSHRSLKSQKFSEKGQKYYNINIIPKPPTYNYCSRFIHQGVCYQPACLLQHEMSQELESYLAQLILHYVRSNLEREAWSLIDRHTSARQNSTLLMISLLKALARHIVEMESINLFPNIKVPSHIASPLNIAKVETLCDFHRGQDAYRLLRQCYNSASLFSAELLITIFIRYCEHCPEREAVSPWEKILLWQYEKPGNPFEEKLKDMFNFGWLKVHINARNFNRVCEVYSHLCRTLSTPSMFFTSITCSVITFFTNTGQRKRSFWVLDEVRRLKANDASIFIALIPTDKESAMCVLHELSELSQLVCELRVPLPTCTWDLLFTLMINHANFTLAVSLLICAMQISLFRPEIDVLEKILFDCYRGGPMLMQPLSNLIRALPAEYLNRMRPSLHRLLTFLTHEPPPAQHIKDIIIHQCQGYGINLFPNSDVSGYKIHSEGGTNAHSVMQCSLGVHNVDGRVAQYGTVPGERDTRHGHMASVDVSSSCHRFSSLESRRSLGAFEYQMNRIRNNENTQLTIGFGNSKDSNITKKLPENSGNFGRSFIGSSSFTTKKMSFESRCSTDSIYSQELCSRKNISRVYANQHSVASSGPRLLKNTTYSSYLNQEESSAPTGSDFPNRLMHVSTTTTRHEEQLISPAPVYHGKSYTVNTACQDLLKTQTEISSLGLHSHKRSINLSQEDLPGVPVDKRELATGNHRWRVSKKQEVDLNTQGKESEDFNVPQCQESYDHTQTNVQKKASKSVPGYSQTYKETRCQGSLSEDVAGVVSRHVSALSNSTSLGSCINSDKQEREKIPKYDKKNVYHKNGQHKLSSEQHAELCSPHGTGSVVQAQGGVLQCSSENTRLHCDSNQSGSASEFPTKQVPLSNAEPKQLCNSVRESSSKVKMTEMSSALGAQGNLATQTAEQGKASCNREHSNVQTCIQKTAMVSEAEALPSNTAIISKFKDGNYSLSCSVSHVTKQMGLLQRTVSKKCVQKKPVTVSKPCVSTTPESRDLPLPGGVMIDVEGCSYSPQAYELEGYGDELDVEHVEFAANACQSIQVNQIVRDLRMIAELNSERLKKIKLVKIFNLLTKKDDIHSVGANLATILKSVSGKRSRVFTPAEEELIGRLGVSLMVKCIEQCYPDQALCVIQSLHHHKISFYSCMPINKENPPSEHKLAVMALDVLHQMQNLKLFTDILEEIYWSGGTEDVKLRLNMLSKVLGTCFHSLVNGSASISKETLWFIIKILASLVKYYQHDVQTISGEYNNIINLPEFLRKAWEYSQGCEDQEAHSELYRVICSSLDFGVDLSHEITHNLKHFRTDVTYQMSKSARYSEKISSPQQKMSSNAHYKGCGKTGREAHPDVSYCINDSESRNMMNSSSGPGGSTSVNTCYQDLRQAGSITRNARGAHSYSIQVTVKGDEAISNTNNTLESNSETHRTTELMGGNRGRAESRRFTTRNKRRKKLWRRPLMRTQITEW
ncbi:uncharacterized protein [Procambarus clarkii]|uniref:uncharacterized protein n=1 Tax=Procambarus clarkii TaxID=6728 RepID=UPI00374372D8